MDLQAVTTSEDAQAERFLYRWQLDALTSWLRCGRQGVIEAVTGSGKTNVALAAARDAHRRDLFVLVIVPSRVLMEQWHARLTEAMPECTIGRLGDSSNDRPPDCDVLVTTRHSAAARKPRPPEGKGGLLIADECHGFGGKVLRRSLMTDYQERMGLTATLERSDDAVDTIILPYFSGICFRYGFGDAIGDGVCAQPRVAFVAVPLTEEERSEYVKTEQTLVTSRQVLRQIPGMQQDTFGEFLAAVQHLADNDGGPNGRAANDYLSAFSMRREIVANSSSKYEVLSEFARTIKSSDGTLLFTETIKAANHAINRLDPVVAIEIITGETSKRDRKRILSSFRDQRLNAVAAPRVLDEGVDVPDANLGIVVSASRTRRQMIQRMGRILRRKQAGSGARFVIIFASDTLEDPTAGQDRDGFVEEIQDISESTRIFQRGEFSQLEEFLDYEGPAVVTEPERIGPLSGESAQDLDLLLFANDDAERYVHLRHLDWTDIEAAGDALAVPDINVLQSSPRPYLRVELPTLPAIVEERKKRQKPKRLSTGEAPLVLQAVDGGWALKCTGCGTMSEVTKFKFKAFEQTITCNCRE